MRASTSNLAPASPAILTSAGAMVEWAKFSAYGIPIGLPAGDIDSDFITDTADVDAIETWAVAYDVRADLDLDGDVDGDDWTIAQTYEGTQLGWTVLSADTVANRAGYAGYQKAINLDISHVRNRMLEPHLGRWTRRDPLGLVDGLNRYEYVTSKPQLNVDATGTHGGATYKILSHNLEATRRSFRVKVRFEVTTTAGTNCANGIGWIVQEVIFDGYFYDCNTYVPLFPPAPVRRYWEAFQVFTPRYSKIAFRGCSWGGAPATAGYMVSTGWLGFYCDAEVSADDPSRWSRDPNHPSGGLPFTETPPSWWVPSSVQSWVAVQRDQCDLCSWSVRTYAHPGAVGMFICQWQTTQGCIVGKVNCY